MQEAIVELGQAGRRQGDSVFRCEIAKTRTSETWRKGEQLYASSGAFDETLRIVHQWLTTLKLKL